MAWGNLFYGSNSVEPKCEIDISAKIPVIDNNYFDNHSVYERCKCIDKIKSSLEVLVKNEPTKYNAYLDIYKKKYSDNNCDEVFKNYTSTNAQDIYNSVSQTDKARIDADTIKQRNFRLYVAMSVLIVAIGVVTVYKTKND